jgi:DNA repair protein RadA/Sms
MILAVLEAHAGVRLGGHDVYLNVAGGLKIAEPAADLAAAAALVSSLTGAVLPSDTVYFGEIGLSGAIRPVNHAAARLKEAAKLGFASAVAPPDTPGASAKVGHIGAMVAAVAAQGVAGGDARPQSGRLRHRESLPS